MMTARRVAVFLLACSSIAGSAVAGTVYAPAHRTRDGSLVPANVSTVSASMHGGAVRTVRSKAHGQSARRVTAEASPRIASNAFQSPLLQNARPLR